MFLSFYGEMNLVKFVSLKKDEMDKKQVFQEIIRDFFQKSLETVRDREIEVPFDVPKVVSLMGPRRAGKTHCLFELIKRLRKQMPTEQLVYVNFEDDRLFPLQLEDLDAMLRGYYEMYPGNRNQKVWFFLDEIQEVPNWEKFVRRLQDQENCRIYLTGSSSKLLSRELATSLRGRTLPVGVLPLSFREFLQFNEVEADEFSSQGKALYVHWLNRYLRQGGFPELVYLPESLHRPTLQEYLDLILYRDVVERHKIKNTALLRYLLKYLLVNVANQLSMTKVYNDLKSQGLRIAKNTVFEYLSYLEEAFVLFKVDVWHQSVRVQAINPSKIYAVDHALKHLMSLSDDQGRIIENVVFMELKRRGYHPHYFRNGKEVDFFWQDGELVNVTVSIADGATYKRETESLFNAMKKTGKKRALLLTMDDEQIIEKYGTIIRVLPLWKFLTADPKRPVFEDEA